MALDALAVFDLVGGGAHAAEVVDTALADDRLVRLRVAFVALLACAVDVRAVQPYRYEIHGTLTLDAPVQRNGELCLNATLTPTVRRTDTAVARTSGRFALAATLAARSPVCYSDTILRDDYDGDGFRAAVRPPAFLRQGVAAVYIRPAL